MQVAAAMVMLLAPSVLMAHAALLRSRPSSGEHISPPTELRLTFSESPELTFSTVTLLDAAGQRVSLGTVAIAPDSRRTLVVPVPRSLQAGLYTVRWQVAGSDGHPIRGEYQFTVDGAASMPPTHHDPSTFPSGPTGFDAESPAYVALRWLQFVATVVILGALCFGSVILPGVERDGPAGPGLSADMNMRSRRLAFGAALVLSVLVVLRLAAQSFAMHGPAEFLTWESLQKIVSRTRWGWGWAMQAFGVAVVAVSLAGLARQRKTQSPRWWLAWIGGVLIAISMAMSGHAMAVPMRPMLAILADALHVLASGAWLGSLLLVLVVGVPAARRQADGDWPFVVAGLVRRLHPVALGAVILLVLTGGFAAWQHVPSVAALWQSSYGRILLVKLALAAIALGTGAYNARRVRPMVGTVRGAQHFATMARAELAAGVLVLLITAILVATPTAIAN